MTDASNIHELTALPDNDETLIRASKISGYTGIARQTHARWRHEGAGPMFVRLGRRMFYRAGDVRAWINERVRQNTITL